MIVGGRQSSRLSLYGINAVDGSLLWNYRDNDPIATISVSRMNFYKGCSASSNYIFTCSVTGTSLRLHRIQLTSTTPYPVSAFSYTFATAPTCFDTYGVN